MTLDPKIYRRAAERVATPQYLRGCCSSIGMIAHGWSVGLMHKLSFQDYLSPTNFRGAYWMGVLNEKNKLCRSLALLFMEQIAKDLMKEKKNG